MVLYSIQLVSFPVCSHAKTPFELLDTAHPKVVFFSYVFFSNSIIFYLPILQSRGYFFSSYTFSMTLAICCRVDAYQ